jgi:hypothetical protein
MATYKIDPELSQEKRRTVICEQCGKKIGQIRSLSAYLELPARLLIKNWPELAESVRQHEQECRARPSAN